MADKITKIDDNTIEVTKTVIFKYYKDKLEDDKIQLKINRTQIEDDITKIETKLAMFDETKE